MKEELIVSKQRVKDYGEVYTPRHIVKQMCDLVQSYCFDERKTFFEPACGNGNFLIEILHRKLTSVIEDDDEPITMLGRMYVALGSLFGCDLLEDNIAICKSRLRQSFLTYTKGNDLVADEMILDIILDSNLKVANSLEDTVTFCQVEYDEIPKFITLNYFHANLKTGEFTQFIKTGFNLEN